MPFPPDANSTDRELLARLRRGDRSAATALVARLEPLVSRMVFRLTGWHNETQDIVQDVFLAIQESGHAYRGDSSLETWVTAITIHRCRRWQRDYRQRADDDAANTEPLDHTDHQNRLEIREEVQRALQALNQELREVIVLRYLEERTLDEIARLLGVRKNTLEVRLHRARKQLGSVLKQKVEGETR